MNHWTQNLEEFRRAPEAFLAARNITAHSFVLDILEVGETTCCAILVSKYDYCQAETVKLGSDCVLILHW